MLRADNTTVIVLALQEREAAPIPMHRDEILVDMASGIDRIPFPGTTYNTCEVQKVSASCVVYPFQEQIINQNGIHFGYTNIFVYSLPFIFLSFTCFSPFLSSDLTKLVVVIQSAIDSPKDCFWFFFRGQQEEHEDGMFYEEDEIFGEEHEGWTCLEW